MALNAFAALVGAARVDRSFVHGTAAQRAGTSVFKHWPAKQLCRRNTRCYDPRAPIWTIVTKRSSRGVFPLEPRRPQAVISSRCPVVDSPGRQPQLVIMGKCLSGKAASENLVAPKMPLRGGEV